MDLEYKIHKTGIDEFTIEGALNVHNILAIDGALKKHVGKSTVTYIVTNATDIDVTFYQLMVYMLRRLMVANVKFLITDDQLNTASLLGVSDYFEFIELKVE